MMLSNVELTGARAQRIAQDVTLDARPGWAPC
jgi:hypothetical protein